MSEENENAGEVRADGPVAGERLAEARRTRQISLPDIARELHLDEPKVQALEENRFDVLGAPVFAKGHLRKYAEIVGIPVDDIMADYYALNRATGAPPVVGRPRPRRRGLQLNPKLLLIPVVIALGAAAWWVFGIVTAPGDTAPDVQTPAPQQQQPAPQQAETAPERAVAEPSDSVPAAAEDTPPPAREAPLVEPAPIAENPAPTVAVGEARLELVYTGDCWTEVTDADGERLFFDLGRAGRTVNVSGPAPLRVLLGNSDNVSVAVNGRAYTIADSERRGETARLTINP